MIKDDLAKNIKRRPKKPVAPVAAPEKPDTPTTPARRPLSPALKRVAERALQVSEEEVAGYLPREIDVSIAEAFLAGATNFQGVAEAIGVTAPTVSQVLRDPLPCAWICTKLRSMVTSRLGLVDAAMLGRALGGNVNAARLLYDRFDGMSKNASIDIGDLTINYNQYTDADLDALIKARSNQIREIAANVSSDEQRAPAVGAEPLEVEFELEETPAAHNAAQEGEPGLRPDPAGEGGTDDEADGLPGPAPGEEGGS